MCNARYLLKYLPCFCIVAQIAQFQLNYLSMHTNLCLPPTILMIILFNNNYYNNTIYNIFIISYLIYLLYNNISIYNCKYSNITIYKGMKNNNWNWAIWAVYISLNDIFSIGSYPYHIMLPTNIMLYISVIYNWYSC